MSRRRLEAAIQAGKAIEEGRDPKLSYDVNVYSDHEFEDTHTGVFSLQYSHDGSKLAVGYGDGGIEIFSTQTGEKKREVRHHRPTGLAITCLRFHPEQQHLVYGASAEGEIAVCSVVYAASDHKRILEPNNEINCLDFNQTGENFASGGRDLSVRIYDSATNQLVHTYKGYDYFSADQPDVCGHARRVFALRYHPEDKDVFISGGWDNHLKIWDSRTEDGVQRTINGPHICGDGLDIKGNKILTGSWVATKALQLWDYRTGGLLQDLPLDVSAEPAGGDNGNSGRHKKGEYVYSAHFAGGSEDDLIFAGGTGTYSAVLVSSKTAKVVAEVEYGKTVQAVDSTCGGRKFALAGASNRLLMAKMT